MVKTVVKQAHARPKIRNGGMGRRDGGIMGEREDGRKATSEKMGNDGGRRRSSRIGKRSSLKHPTLRYAALRSPSYLPAYTF